METRRKALTTIAAVALLTLALYYLAKLGGLGMASHRAGEDEARLSAQVTEMAASVDALGTAVHDAESDDFVENWAREERKWARDGDHPLAPVPATGTATVATESPGDSRSAWERFKAWLGGQ